MNSRIVSTVCVLAALLVAGCQKNQTITSQATWAEPTQPVTILRDLHGNDTGFTQPGVFIIDSRKALEESGSVQLSELNINFDSEMAVVLALGEQNTTGYWARITGMQIGKSGALYVQGIANKPDNSAAATKSVTYPIDAVVVNKVSVPEVHPEIQSVVGQTMK